MQDTGFGDFEFERKFLVRELPAAVLAEPDPVLIVQSYYLAAQGYALRVRLEAPADGLPELAGVPDDDVLEAVADRVTFSALTAKGPYVGGTRYEAERELDPTVGLAMVRLGGQRVVKRRYAVWLGDDGWVLDAFLGGNAGLIVAECERGGPVTDLMIPDFCVTEISDDPRFGNEALAGTPFRGWRGTFEEELRRHGPRFLQQFGRNRHGLSSEL